LGERGKHFAGALNKEEIRMRPLPKLFLLATLAVLAVPTAANAGHGTNPVEASPNMIHLGNSKPATDRVNSDLAFWGNLVYAGNYNGFRIIDVSDPRQPRELVDYPCRGPQNDVSVWRSRGGTLLFLSVDNRQIREECSADDPTRTTGWEGIRIFDVSNPRAPRFIDGVATDCGSHTHTLIPVRKTGTQYRIDTRNPNRVLIYVSSYPLTQQGVHGDLGEAVQDPGGGFGTICTNLHNHISIIDVPLNAPQNSTVKRHPLDDDTVGAGVVAVRGCHDIQAFLPLRLAAASCLGEGQMWDISDPWNPCTVDDRCHTHVRNAFPLGPASPNTTEIWHSAQFTWDGRYVVFDDEHGGGSGSGCAGSADRTGNGWIYEVRRPPSPLVGPLGRFMIPRNQLVDQPQPQECTIHNGNFITTNERYLHVSAWYKGGNDVIDWTNPMAPFEAGWFDQHNVDGRDHDDVWSTYWYDGFLYANSGLDRPDSRGLDIYRFLHRAAADAVRLGHMNPQTQEVFLGQRRDDDDDDDDGDDDDDDSDDDDDDDDGDDDSDDDSDD
jgi:LVIVD repeat